MPKLLSLLILSLPPLLTILSFSFAVVSTLSKDWAHYDQLSTASGADLTTPAPQELLYRIHRGLLIKCSVGTSDVNGGTGIIPVCTRFPITGGLRSCDPSTGGNLHLCQLIHLSTSLMVTSCVLLGVSLLLTLVLFGLSFKTIALRGAFLVPVSGSGPTRSRSSRIGTHSGTVRNSKTGTAARANTPSSQSNTAPPPLNLTLLTILPLPLSLLLLGSTISCFLGTVIGIFALTSQQRSAGDWIVTGTDPSDITPWVMGTAGLGYGSASWVLAGLAGLLGVLVWGVPKIGWRADGEGEEEEGRRNGNDRVHRDEGEEGRRDRVHEEEFGVRD